MAMDMEIDLTRPQPQQTQDSDTDTPPRNTLPTRLHHARNPHAPCVSYKECMKNHAASIGGHALDGCCEFMPGPTFNPLDPTSLKCGACGCHRNFHRRDPDDPTPLNHVPTPARVPHSPPSASQLLLSLSHSPSGPSDEVNPMGTGTGMVTVTGSGHGNNGNFSTSSRKRFRTKFSQEQKEKMYEFSERIGWKLKKGEEKLVEDFVKEIGVGRSVFKVWMHNNKHNSTSIIKLQDDNNNNNKVISKVEDINNNNIHVVNYLHGSSNSSNNNNNNNNGSKTSNVVVSSNNVGNCGASSVFDNNHNHRQFNFGNGGGQQEAAQAQ